jgi:hypothetical protein
MNEIVVKASVVPNLMVATSIRVAVLWSGRRHPVRVREQGLVSTIC